MIGMPLDQLHDEVGPAAVGRAGVEDAGDVGMVHQRQGLPLGLEAGDDVARVHARLDDLQRDLAAHGMLLLGHEDQAHAPLADLLHQLVGADHRAGSFGDPIEVLGRISGRGLAHESASDRRDSLIRASTSARRPASIPHASSR